MLVITLMVVMILGLVAIVGLLVTRLGGSRPLPEMPASMTLPEGAVPAAVTFARDWLVVVSEDGRVILFDREGGDPVSVTPLP